MKIILLIALLSLSFNSIAQTPRQIENEKAFAKVYGYVKYFYPSDEANAIDWGKFAIYGAKKVEACKSDNELQDSLNTLVKVLMPGVKIIKSSDKTIFDTDLLKPKDLKGYNVITWQHLGVGLVKDKRSPYQSARTNRPTIFKTTFRGNANASTSIKAENFAGKNFELTARARRLEGNGNGYLWFRVDLDSNKMGLLENMSNRPITSKDWQTYKITGTIDQDAKRIVFGTFFEGIGEFEVDDFSLKIEGKEVIKVDFEKEITGKEPILLAKYSDSFQSGKYSFTIKQVDSNKYMTIQSPIASLKDEIFYQNLFTKHASFGEYIDKPINESLKIHVPIALYGTKENTYPKVNAVIAEKALSAINTSEVGGVHDIHFRIGNLINTWSVFQHFYPYFDVVKTNWEANLSEAMVRTYQDSTDLDFANTLKYLTAKLKDGHIFISYSKDVNIYVPPIIWKWVEGKLVITAVLDKGYDVKQGDVVEKINGEDATLYFKKINQYISAATTGYLNYRAKRESLLGLRNSAFNLVLSGGKEIKLTRSVTPGQYYALLPKQDTIKQLGNQITYINISNANMKTINSSLTLLKNSKAIICDLRGYPTDNIDLIEYFMVKKDTSKNWLQMPEIIYPDRERIAGTKNEGWALKPRSPHLNAKVFFLVDGQDISKAEGHLSFVEHYKLATIIGEPTAGTNGNKNIITLPGGYSISFTGMKALKHDGSQHHGIGIIPNINVQQTIKGISENRDEVLERAIAEALK